MHSTEAPTPCGTASIVRSEMWVLAVVSSTTGCRMPPVLDPLDVAGCWQPLEARPVIHTQHQDIRAVCAELARHIEFKRQVSTYVLPQQLSIEPHLGVIHDPPKMESLHPARLGQGWTDRCGVPTDPFVSPECFPIKIPSPGHDHFGPSGIVEARAVPLLPFAELLSIHLETPVLRQNHAFPFHPPEQDAGREAGCQPEGPGCCSLPLLCRGHERLLEPFIARFFHAGRLPKKSALLWYPTAKLNRRRRNSSRATPPASDRQPTIASTDWSRQQHVAIAKPWTR